MVRFSWCDFGATGHSWEAERFSSSVLKFAFARAACMPVRPARRSCLMTLHRIIAVLTIAAGAVVSTNAAYAFDRGCGDRAVTCYEKVRTPDIYANVARKVLVQPASREIVRTPAVYGLRPERVVVERAHVERIREPARYATRMKRELVRPARVSYGRIPAVVKTVRERVKVGKAGYRWVHSRSLLGRERLCKVRTRPLYRTVMRKVVVQPAEQVRYVRPALYKQVPTRVLVREARTRRLYSPEVKAIVKRRVLLKPAERHVIHHPAVIGTRYERVLVREGGYAWRASDHRKAGLFGR